MSPIIYIVVPKERTVMNTWCMVLVLSLCCPLFSFAAQTKVLIIQSYHPSLAWVRQCETGIKEIFSGHAEISTFYMDTKRIPESRFHEKVDAAWDSYTELKPDLVMIGDDNGLRLLGPHFKGTMTPVVFFGINNNPRSYINPIPPNITGLLERLLIIPWLRYLKEILPNASSALVLMDKSQTSQSIFEVNFNNKTKINLAGMSVTCLLAENWEAWKKTVLDAKNHQLIVFPTFHALKDVKGDHVAVEDVVNWTSANSPIPVFTNQDYTIHDQGAVGAYVIQGVSHGRQAAQMALDILNHKRSTAMPPETDRKGLFFFNKKQMKRFHVTLPEDILRASIFQ